VAVANVGADPKVELVPETGAALEPVKRIRRQGPNILKVTFQLPQTASPGWHLRIIDGGQTVESTETIDIVTTNATA